MLIIDDFDKQALKDEILLNRKMKTLSVSRSLELEKRKKNKKNNEFIKKIYKVKRIPCRVGDIVIDYAIYQQFLEKLKGFDVKTVVANQSVMLYYSKSLSDHKGELELFDLTYYFDHFESLPKAVIDYGS